VSVSSATVPRNTLSSVVSVVTEAGTSIFSQALKSAVRLAEMLLGSRPIRKSTMASMVGPSSGWVAWRKPKKRPSSGKEASHSRPLSRIELLR